MGWLIYAHAPPCIRDEIARLCTHAWDGGRKHPVLISHQGSVWYAAVRFDPAEGRLPTGLDATGSFETDATGGYTFAAIFLTTRNGAGWGLQGHRRDHGALRGAGADETDRPSVSHHKRVGACMAPAVPRPCRARSVP